MCLILGFMISLAWVTERNRSTRFGFLPPDQGQRVTAAALDPDAYQRLQSEMQKLQTEKTRLENVLGKEGDQGKVLNDSLQELKAFAGLTEIEGPGVMVTLKDGKSGVGQSNVFVGDQIIHDVDILRVVNEMYASGAEAVSVNEHRIAGTTSIRCVGPTVLINDVRTASPIVIRAIGDTATLSGGLNLPGGVLSEIRSMDVNMVQLEPVTKIRLKAYVGPTAHKVGIVPKDNTK